MNCPYCDGANVEETGKFDLTLIDRNEARHDFECNDCGQLFQIVYKPVCTLFVGQPEEKFC